MQLPRVVSREAWLAERKRLLTQEKQATHARDAINAARRSLPMVRVEKTYLFAGPARHSGPGPAGQESLLELFAGRRQLVVCHVMFFPEQAQACVGCSLTIDNLPHLAHLHARETTLVVVSRAPLAQLSRFQQRMGWTIPWYSSLDSEFNYDFHATTDEAVRPVEYNYRDKATLERLGQSYHVQGEQPGVSVFLREDDAVFHTYSTYGRGLDLLENTNNYLDLTVLGRGEGWGGMPDLHGLGRHWLRHHDRYGSGE
jgi:predicted dithiol-disulfide oxidoreductase (DUF899 family)